MNPWDCQSKRQYAIDGVYRTLDAGESAGGQAHGICYDITGTSSNSMKSPTPDSCFRERMVGRTLDTFVGSPECNQGGMVVVAETDRHGVCYALQGNGIDRALTAGCNGSGWREQACYTLNTIDRHAVALDCRNMRGQTELSGTLQAKPNGGHSLNYQNPVIFDTTQITSPQNKSKPKPGDPCHTLGANQHPPLCVGNGQLHQMSMAEQSNTLDCMHDQQAILMQGNHPRKYIVRRLTPLECCRLQGFPDWWEDGVEGSDSARYKMWGNGIALPCAVDVLRRIAKEMEEKT